MRTPALNLEIDVTGKPTTKTIMLDKETRELFSECLEEAKELLKQHGK